ncbi:hypothetical protein A4X06_0g7189 [Tilletia controversa]|uniref:cellulase n=2 Tax=Tilletia TaxID=13289 RepID=A0A8X7MNM3_9BASI|nr:hypothetical protein A4X06_0g7189 [Tilletia controversa]KAE8261243.1 hypothetical protein A4X03_0g3418 [Tilletia caries]
MQVFAHTFLLLATSLLFLGALAEATTSSLGEQRRHHHRHHHHGHHGHRHHPADQGTAPPATNVPPKDALTAAGGGTPTPAKGIPPWVPVIAPAPIGDKPEDKCELSGGMATQYWDCCKIAAAWPGNPNVTRPAYSCAKDGETVLEDTNVRSGCGGGTAYACNRHQPFVSPTNPMLSYAIGARPHELGIHSFYGACYSIKFKELPGKTLVFQALNTGDYPKLSQIDIQAESVVSTPVQRSGTALPMDGAADLAGSTTGANATNFLFPSGVVAFGATIGSLLRAIRTA